MKKSMFFSVSISFPPLSIPLSLFVLCRYLCQKYVEGLSGQCGPSLYLSISLSHFIPFLALPFSRETERERERKKEREREREREREKERESVCWRIRGDLCANKFLDIALLFSVSAIKLTDQLENVSVTSFASNERRRKKRSKKERLLPR
jgi:hypothetical protein